MKKIKIPKITVRHYQEEVRQIKNTINKGRKVVLILITIGFISPTVFGASQSIKLGEGWNTVSIDIQDVSSSDLQDQCDSLTTYQGEHVWALESGSWSNPDTLPTAKGVYLRTTSDCNMDLEGDSANPSELSISEGWNIISLSGSITWESVLKCDIQDFEGHKSWILTGNSWSNLDSGSDGSPPTLGDGSEIRNKGILLKSSSECTVYYSDGGIPMPGAGTSDSGLDETGESTNTDEETNIEPGDLYFYDTEADKALVNNEAGSSGDGAKFEYDMDDKDVVGGFTSYASSGAERTIIVTNAYNGETLSRTASGEYVAIRENGHAWGTEESGVYEMSSSTPTLFKVEVEDPNTGEVLQQETFQFNPSSQGESETTDSQSESVTTSYDARNEDYVIESGSNLEIDGSDSKNAYVTWKTLSDEYKTVEIDFVVNDAGNARFEVCQEGCGDNKDEIVALYYLTYAGQVFVNEPYILADRGEFVTEGLQTGEEYTFKIIQDYPDVKMSIEGPGVDHSQEISNINSFDYFSIDTEEGTNDAKEGIDMTVKEVTIG